MGRTGHGQNLNPDSKPFAEVKFACVEGTFSAAAGQSHGGVSGRTFLALSIGTVARFNASVATLINSGQFQFARLAAPLLLVLRVVLRPLQWMTLLALFSTLGTGCGSFMARRMVQAPNTYPTWLASPARVLLAFNRNLLTNAPVQYADVGPPAARLQYRVVEPADYQLNVIATNWVERGEVRAQFVFRAEAPRTNAWSAAPRGTVVLLHGYGLAEFALVPWAWQLAQVGWRCVLVDLRGHGKSTGKAIYYGLKEARDMSQLLDGLAQQGQLARPVAALGESYGAALALRWRTTDPRVGSVVAIAPYGVLSNAVLNICHDYASLLPQVFIRAGLKQLPAVLGVPGDDLNTTTVLARHPVTALFIAGCEDDVMPPADVRSLCAAALPGSHLIVVSGATHETVPYCFSELLPPVLAWLTASETNRRR